MKRLVLSAIILAFAGVDCAAAGGADQTLKAVVAITQSTDATKQPHVVVHFELINTGKSNLNPAISGTVIVIDGKPLQDSAFILGNGPRDASFENLAPDKKLQFAYQLDRFFTKPGRHTVMWRGKNFQSNTAAVNISRRKEEKPKKN
jgi:hypothetical protein